MFTLDSQVIQHWKFQIEYGKNTQRRGQPEPPNQQLKEYCKMVTAHRFHSNIGLSILCVLCSKFILLYCCKWLGSIAYFYLLLSLSFKTLQVENDGGMLRRETFCILCTVYALISSLTLAAFVAMHGNQQHSLKADSPGDFAAIVSEEVFSN